MTAAIRCRNLCKTYPGKPPVEAVRGLDLEVRAGECFGLLGPNGAGKTTTVEILEGILGATSGDVELFGLTWRKDEKALRQKLGVSLQETKFADKLSVEETVRLFGSFYEHGRPAEDVMAEVGLVEKRSAWVVNLSGGQRQRLAVACAIVGDPEILFLDEPTTGLDPQSRRQLWDIIRSLRARGRTILLTTHYMDEAEKLCDRVAVVDHGRVIALGSPAELIRSLGGDHVVELALERNGTGDVAPADGGAASTGGTAMTGGAAAAGGTSAARGSSAARGASATRGASAPGNAAAQAVEDSVDLEPLLKLPSVRSARMESGTIQLTVGEPHVAIPALLEHFGRDARALSQLTTRHASLEDVFVALTGRHLRDE